jgi:hypothetical protein
MPRRPAAAIGDEPVPIGEPDEDGEFDDDDHEDDDDGEDDEPMQARGCACTSVASVPRAQA